MRSALVWFGLAALVVIQPSNRHRTIDADRAIPRFILHKDTWVCVDRNPRQLNRQDCFSAKMETGKR
jgi:hypothetical protein